MMQAINLWLINVNSYSLKQNLDLFVIIYTDDIYVLYHASDIYYITLQNSYVVMHSNYIKPVLEIYYDSINHVCIQVG
jgi:hypothetical protein